MKIGFQIQRSERFSINFLTTVRIFFQLFVCLQVKFQKSLQHQQIDIFQLGNLLLGAAY